MKPLKLSAVSCYINANIGPQFHAKKIARIKKLSLDDVVKRKNPYLFKAKGVNSANDYITAVLDATVSSGEETTFGNFLENIAIFVAKEVYEGRKSAVVGLDLEFENKKDKYLITIKSGPNWGNSGQIKSLVKNFNAARKTLLTSGGVKGVRLVFVEGCCYGSDNSPEKSTHTKLCGQSFWSFLSGGNERLYRDIIEPLGHLAKERNDEIVALRSQKINIFTADFINRFCDNGIINWDKLIQFNSGSDRK